MAPDLLDNLPPADPAETRRAARDAIEPNRGRLLGAVLRYIRERGEHGATDEELCAALGLRPDTGRARRCELRDCGDVVASTRRRPTRAGRAATVWVSARFAQSDAADLDTPPAGDDRRPARRAAQPATIDAQPDAADLDAPDGWPAGAVEPGTPCPRCDGLAVWWDAMGGQHCQRCEADALRRCLRLASLAALARQRSAPARHTTAPGTVPAATHTRPQGPPGT